MTLRKLGKSLADARWVAVRVLGTALQLLSAWDTNESVFFCVTQSKNVRRCLVDVLANRALVAQFYSVVPSVLH